MAGGIGSRFWPMSTEEFPKQFHDILGTGRSLIRQTYERLTLVCDEQNIFIVTNAQYKNLVLEQIPELSDSQVLCEPFRRNTAPCVAYATYKIQSINKDANIIVAPADHLILKETAFVEAVNTAIEKTAKDHVLCTLSIKPTRPDTGYGYIHFKDGENDLRKVAEFKEKPDHKTAKAFLENGSYYWNSGIFIWSVKAISKALENHLPEIETLLKSDEYGTDNETNFINTAYEKCPSISIDYGVMEKEAEVFTVLADIGWSDLGTWGSLYTHIDKDKNQNAVVGNKVNMYNSENCIVHIPQNKTAVIQGLDGYIVVEANGTLLVCKKQDEQLIKQFMKDATEQKG